LIGPARTYCPVAGIGYAQEGSPVIAVSIGSAPRDLWRRKFAIKDPAQNPTLQVKPFRALLLPQISTTSISLGLRTMSMQIVRAIH
jgi:hypothetical protein